MAILHSLCAYVRRCVLLICGPASDNDAPSIIWTADLREWYRFTPTATDVGQWTLLRDEVALCFHQLFAGPMDTRLRT